MQPWASLIRTLTGLACVLGLSLALMAPSSAESVDLRDPRDRHSAGLDIRRAHFTNTGPDIGGTLTFHQLGKQGTVQITITSAESTLRLEASRSLDGTLRKSLTLTDAAGSHEVDCKIGHTWTSISDQVRLIVSRYCLVRERWGGTFDITDTHFQAATYDTWQVDSTRSVRVRRTE